MPFTAETALLIGTAVLLGGVVKGATGFGYAVVATGILTVFIMPRDAVVVLILPILASNMMLAERAWRDGINACIRRFRWYVVGAVMGTVAGMMIMSALPTTMLAIVLGAGILLYVAAEVSAFGFRPTGASQSPAAGDVLLGAGSGAVFGGTNIGVQFVAYLDHAVDDHDTFVGVLATLMLVVGLLRAGIAAGTGLYHDRLLLISMLAAIPGLTGVFIGQRVADRVQEQRMRHGVYLLLVIIGLRLLLRGMG